MSANGLAQELFLEARLPVLIMGKLSEEVSGSIISLFDCSKEKIEIELPIIIANTKVSNLEYEKFGRKSKNANAIIVPRQPTENIYLVGIIVDLNISTDTTPNRIDTTKTIETAPSKNIFRCRLFKC